MLIYTCRALAAPFLRDRLLHVLLVLALLLSLGGTAALADYPRWVDWPTILVLAGMILLTKGIELSGYLEHLGRHIINRLGHERPLALFLVGAAALLSTVLTNDIALFVVVPLTLGLRNLAGLPIARLVIFEALAVNAGSLLTPIGNPQNILLWQRSHLSFAAFTWQMAPLAVLLLALLCMLTAWSFPNQPIRLALQETRRSWDTRLLAFCAVLYIGFVLAVELGHPGWGLLGVLACVLARYPRLVLDVDWSLIAVFILMFVDIRLLTLSAPLQPWLDGIPHYAPHQVFLAGLLGSQLISNVPTTILLVKYLPASKLIAYAVNAGGFGFMLGSLANLIALRLLGERDAWWRFHVYSVPCLVVGGAIAYLLV